MAISVMRKKAALKQRILKSLKVRALRIKYEMGKMREDQRRIREEQRNIGERFGKVKRQCNQLREETQLIMKRTACNRIRLFVMFNILRARENGDFEKAATLTRFLSFVSD